MPSFCSHRIILLFPNCQVSKHTIGTFYAKAEKLKRSPPFRAARSIKMQKPKKRGGEAFSALSRPLRSRSIIPDARVSKLNACRYIGRYRHAWISQNRARAISAEITAVRYIFVFVILMVQQIQDGKPDNYQFC